LLVFGIKAVFKGSNFILIKNRYSFPILLHWGSFKVKLFQAKRREQRL
jgi:dynein heavy chain